MGGELNREEVWYGSVGVVSLGILMRTIYNWLLWRCEGEWVSEDILVRVRDDCGQVYATGLLWGVVVDPRGAESCR